MKRSSLIGGIASLCIMALAAACGPSPDPKQTIRDHYFYGGLAAYQEEMPEEAARQWRRAAELGDAEAARNLGHLYRQGKGVEADGHIAAAWYQVAADAGVVSAVYNLGMLYYKGGPGLAADHELGLSYLGQAAEKGYGPAKEILKQLSVVSASPAPSDTIAAPAPPPQAASAPVPEPPAPPPPPAMIEAQIGSYRTRNAAEQDWKRLRAVGLDHKVIGNKVEGQGHWYRLVAIGPALEVEELCARAPSRGLACWSRGRRFPVTK